jgi:hypothetical protein
MTLFEVDWEVENAIHLEAKMELLHTYGPWRVADVWILPGEILQATRILLISKKKKNGVRIRMNL